MTTAKPADAGWVIPLADTCLGREEVDAVARVLRSGWVTAGPETERFESAFAARVGARHAIAVCNGTAALHLANIALGVGPGAEVLCPNLTFVASANATRYTGGEVVFTDVSGPEDLTVSPEDIERKITPRTRAITVVHYAGFACRMEPILGIASRHGLAIIEDCAHAPGARVEVEGALRFAGALGAVGCFSFFGNKNMTTGEGGMLTTNDDRLAELLRRYRSHGMTTMSYDRFRGHAHGYDVTVLGHNYRTDDIHSAIGLAQLQKLDEIHFRRRRVYRWYLDEFRSVEHATVPFADRDLELATPHILSVVVRRGGATIRARLDQARIQTSRHYDLINSFSTYRGCRGETPVAAGLDLITLPFGPGLTRDQVARIAGAFREV